MTTKIADDTQSIAQRLKEIEAEKMQRIMGTPLEEAKEPEVVWSYMGEAAIGWPKHDLPAAFRALNRNPVNG